MPKMHLRSYVCLQHPLSNIWNYKPPRGNWSSEDFVSRAVNAIWNWKRKEKCNTELTTLCWWTLIWKAWTSWHHQDREHTRDFVPHKTILTFSLPHSTQPHSILLISKIFRIAHIQPQYRLKPIPRIKNKKQKKTCRFCPLNVVLIFACPLL